MQSQRSTTTTLFTHSLHSLASEFSFRSLLYSPHCTFDLFLLLYTGTDKFVFQLFVTINVTTTMRPVKESPLPVTRIFVLQCT